MFIVTLMNKHFESKYFEVHVTFIDHSLQKFYTLKCLHFNAAWQYVVSSALYDNISFNFNRFLSFNNYDHGTKYKIGSWFVAVGREHSVDTTFRRKLSQLFQRKGYPREDICFFNRLSFVVFKILLLGRSLFSRSFARIMMYLLVFAMKICFFFVSKRKKKKKKKRKWGQITIFYCNCHSSSPLQRLLFWFPVVDIYLL